MTAVSEEEVEAACRELHYQINSHNGFEMPEWEDLDDETRMTGRGSMRAALEAAAKVRERQALVRQFNEWTPPASAEKGKS